MSPHSRLVYLRIIKQNVEAYVAELPAKGADWTKLLFRAPINFGYDSADSNKEYHGKVDLDGAAVPVFDAQNDEIIWACHAHVASTTDEAKPVHVFRIGPHFAIQSSDDTKLSASAGSAPSVIVEDGRVRVSVVVGRGSERTPVIVERNDENKWPRLPFNISFSGDVGPQNSLFGGLDSSMKYIYHLRTRANASGTFFLDLIRTSHFKKLSHDPSLQWQTFEITYEGHLGDAIVPLITTDQATGKHRLYVFWNNVDGHGVDTVWVDLRKDGSVDSYERSFKAKAQPDLSLHSSKDARALKVIDLGEQRVLIAWEVNKKPFGKIGTISNSGMIPTGSSGWKEIEFKFDPALQTSADCSPMTAVVVPGNFGA